MILKDTVLYKDVAHSEEINRVKSTRPKVIIEVVVFSS